MVAVYNTVNFINFTLTYSLGVIHTDFFTKAEVYSILLAHQLLKLKHPTFFQLEPLTNISHCVYVRSVLPAVILVTASRDATCHERLKKRCGRRSGIQFHGNTKEPVSEKMILKQLQSFFRSLAVLHETD